MSATPGSISTPPKRRGVRVLVRYLLRFVVVGYLLVILMFSLLQTKLVFPGSLTQGCQQWPLPSWSKLVELKMNDGERTVALYGPAAEPAGNPLPDAANRPTILFFYGNGDNLGSLVNEVDHLRRLGVNVMVPEYVGYGLASGSASETACYTTASAAYEWLVKTQGVDPNQIIVGGWSLGAAVAIDLAAREPVGGLFAFSAFTSAVAVGKAHYPYLPVNLLLKHRFDNISKIPKIKVPIVLGHGRLDEIVPYSMMDELAASAGGPVTRVNVDAAHHNDFLYLGQSQLDEAMRVLIDCVAAGAPTEPQR